MYRLRPLYFVIITLMLSGAGNIDSFSQRKYFEYNNPAALRISRNTFNLLTSKEWHLNRMEVVTRGDTLVFTQYSTHVFQPDKTYKALKSSGTWSIRAKKYLVCKPDTNGSRNVPPDMILCLIALSDSSMVMQKLHTSSRDMFRTYYFSTRPKYPKRVAVLGAPLQYRVEGRENQKFRTRHQLDTTTIDSLSFQFKGPLIGEGFAVSDSGVLKVATADSTYQIRLRSRSGHAGRKIFQAKEPVRQIDHHERFTPNEDEILFAEATLTGCMQTYLEENGIRQPFSLDDQFRQFVGFVDAKGLRVIRIVAFVTYHRGWQSELVTPENHNGVYLSAEVLLKRRTCQNLRLR